MCSKTKLGVLISLTAGQAALAGCANMPGDSSRLMTRRQITSPFVLPQSSTEYSTAQPVVVGPIPEPAKAPDTQPIVQPVGMETVFGNLRESGRFSVAPAASFGFDDSTAIDASNSVIAQATPPAFSGTESQGSTFAVNSMTLADFENLAMANNPTIRELAATTQKAAGFRAQVGLKANPIIGYQAQQLADQGTDQHLIFAEQEFVTGNKLELNRRVLNEALRAQLQELEAQRFRVTTDIRIKFFEALALQRQIQLISDFQNVTNQGLDLAKLRQQAAEGSKIDVLQAKVQKNEIDLDLKRANIRYAAVWRELAALSGTPYLPQGIVQGELPQAVDTFDWNMLVTNIVASSPEYAAAQSRITRARALLARHQIQPLPNLTVQFGAGVDNGTNSGMMNLQVGAPLPIHNKNQGNIAAAHAEYCRAVMEAQRIEAAIKARLATVSQEYDGSLATVQQYTSEILPSADESLKLAEEAYKAGETSFIQVLVARRTYFDSNVQLVLAQADLAAAKAKLDGYVLTGGLDAVVDDSLDSSLRDLTFTQQ